jgi:hypothetical protein
LGIMAGHAIRTVWLAETYLLAGRPLDPLGLGVGTLYRHVSEREQAHKPARKPTLPVREVPRAAARKRMAREEPVARKSVKKARGA